MQRRRRGALAPTLAILGVLVVLLLGLASVWTDVLWYRQLGFLVVYRTQVLTQAAMFVGAAVLMAAAVLGSMIVAYRSRPVYAPVSTEQASLDRYRESIEPLRRLVVVAIPIALGLFAGSAASQEWKTLLLWWNGESFGRTDPQFGLDVGFFVFTLPWLQFVVGFFTAVVFLAGLAAAVTHYLYGGLRLQGGGPRVTSVARIHLAALAAAFLLLRAADYWLGRYELSTKQSRLITGLTYTDANATLTARGVLAAIATVVAVLFVVAALVERFRMLPLYGVVLLVVSAILIGGIYPAIVQRFQVKPSEATLEERYIQKNIDATRAAYGLDTVETVRYEASTTASQTALRQGASTIPGIRLLDPSIVSDTYKQLEQGKQYYSFPESLDVDRYTVDGAVRDAVVAVRELNLSGVPAAQRNWYNDHIAYTHGFGVVAAYGNERTSDGKPSFFQQGIPTRGQLGDYQPRIYFGEQSPEYSIVGGPPDAEPRELDYPDDTEATQQRNTTYAGSGGVSIGSAFNRLLYALKFREQNILLAGSINPQSRILYDRSPRERVEKVAPYLTLDGDPYPSVVDGRVVWILDGYTTSNRYPYSSLRSLDEATSDSVTAAAGNVVALQPQQVNYIRNSVKATVDAYDGTVALYTWDEGDPVLKAWAKSFPTTVKPLSDIGGDLMSHLRYPEDLFKVQRSLLAKYHVERASAFFGGQDYWQVPPDPTVASGSQSASAGQVQPPYYLSIQMPGQAEPRFSLTSTFIPNGGRSVLTGFLAVDADAGSTPGQKRADYGKLRLLQVPPERQVSGPGQVQNNFNADTTVQNQLALLRGGINGASQVENGNLLTLPLAGGLLYVQPVYVRGRGETSYPLLQQVLVGFGDRIGFATTLSAALDQVFAGTGTTTATPPAGSGSTPSPSVGASPGASAGASTAPASPASGDPQAALKQALAEAMQAIKDGQVALAAGDFAKYGQTQAQLQSAVQRAADAQAKLAAAPPAATGSSPAPTGSSPTPAG